MHRVLVAAVGIHDVHVACGWQVSEAQERDLGAVWGPRRAEFFGRVGGEPGLTGAVGVHDVDVTVYGGIALIGDLRPVPAAGGYVVLGGRGRGDLQADPPDG